MKYILVPALVHTQTESDIVMLVYLYTLHMYSTLYFSVWRTTAVEEILTEVKVYRDSRLCPGDCSCNFFLDLSLFYSVFFIHLLNLPLYDDILAPTRFRNEEANHHKKSE